MKIGSRNLMFAAPFAALLLCAAAPDTVDDASLVAYARQPFDHGQMMYKHVDLGVHHGFPVVADFPCSDVCPDNTTRLIHYALDDGQVCSAAAGAQVRLAVPTGVGTTQETFCVPKVLASKHLARTQ